METKTEKDRLENMLCIIKGEKGIHEVGYLVDENGQVNEKARTYLIQEIEALKDILSKCEPKPKRTSHFGFSSRAKKVVQLYIPKTVSSELTKMFGASLSSKLKNQSIECQTVEESCSLKEDVPLLLPCPVNTRLEPSIEEALQGIHSKYTCVVILIHLETKDDVPILQTRATYQKELEKFKNVTFIDMAFNKDDKFLQEVYPNPTALDEIKKFAQNE